MTANTNNFHKFRVGDASFKDYMMQSLSNIMDKTLEEMENVYNDVNIVIKFDRIGMTIEASTDYTLIPRYDFATERNKKK